MLLVAFILVLLSFLPKDAKLGSYSLKPVDMFSDVKSDSSNTGM
jgi:hypothetical protein